MSAGQQPCRGVDNAMQGDNLFIEMVNNKNLNHQHKHVIFSIIPLRAGIRVKFHSQFSPNSTGQQCNLEEAVRFEPNPPRAV